MKRRTIILTLIISRLSCALTISGPIQVVQIENRSGSTKPIKAVESESEREFYNNIICDAQCKRTESIANSVLEAIKK
jgi:hypothetical protein